MGATKRKKAHQRQLAKGLPQEVCPTGLFFRFLVENAVLEVLPRFQWEQA
jgi:hypothetical protein